MEDLDDIKPDAMPLQAGGAFDAEEDLPASPEEVGVARLPSAPAEVQEAVEPPAGQEAAQPIEADETGVSSIQAASAEPAQTEGTGEDDQPGNEDQPDSQAEPVLPPPPEKTGEIQRRRSRWPLITLLGLTFLLLIAAISAYGGYRSGITLRRQAEDAQLAGVIKQQYELGLQDLEEGNYYRARQRFEYVISLDPLYPGAAEKLSAVLFELNSTATPTLVPTPTVTPTPDTRGNQELFNQGQEFLRNSEWGNAIDTLLALRKTDPNYQAVQVDGMLFIALRNRGKDKILLEQDLEGGIYDLTLAKRFGILDSEADGLLTWSQLYITGASFWEIDWSQAAYYFGQVAPQLPNLMDKSGYTAGERYRLSLIEYAYDLADQKKYCQAYKQLEIALSLGADAQVEQDLNRAAELCAKQENAEK